jgi:hypothetical protein
MGYDADHGRKIDADETRARARLALTEKRPCGRDERSGGDEFGELQSLRKAIQAQLVADVKPYDPGEFHARAVEKVIASLPPGCIQLAPSDEVVRQLTEKVKRFTEYALAHGELESMIVKADGVWDNLPDAVYRKMIEVQDLRHKALYLK